MRIQAFPGDTQTAATLDLMASLARQGATDPAVISTAVGIVRWIVPENRLEYWRAIREWLEGHVLYITDPEGPIGTEVIRGPRWLLREIVETGIARGDCDDVAVLGAALGRALGMPARFVVVAFGGSRSYTHVYTELATPGGWADLDVHRPPGSEGLSVSRAAYVEV